MTCWKYQNPPEFIPYHSMRSARCRVIVHPKLVINKIWKHDRDTHIEIKKHMQNIICWNSLEVMRAKIYFNTYSLYLLLCLLFLGYLFFILGFLYGYWFSRGSSLETQLIHSITRPDWQIYKYTCKCKILIMWLYMQIWIQCDTVTSQQGYLQLFQRFGYFDPKP